MTSEVDRPKDQYTVEEIAKAFDTPVDDLKRYAESRTSNDLLDLLRFRVLDYRNATEEARERLMLEAADEIERLRRAADGASDAL